MADTHINAFEMDVQEKLLAVQAAQADYQAAVDRLQAKKLELGLADQPSADTTPKQETPEKPKSSILKKK